MSYTDALVLGVLGGVHLFLFLVVTAAGGYAFQELIEIRRKELAGRVLPRVLGLLAALAFQFIILMSAISILSRTP